MEEKLNYDYRKSKCDKRKKRNPYRHSSRRGYMINGSKKFKDEEDSSNESS